MSKRHCMFQYATSGKYIDVKIHEDTGLITWENAVNLWEKYKPKFIIELEGGLMPEMVIWTGCSDRYDYKNDSFHVNHSTIIEDGRLVERITKVIDPSKINMGEPI